MEIKAIHSENTALLSLFLQHLGKAEETFRYYNKRPLTVIDQHLYTCVAMDGERPVAYGHLDKEGNKVWLGIAVMPAEQGKGIAHLIMDALLKAAYNHRIDAIWLSVDKTNGKAVKLYEQYGFVVQETHPDYWLYKKTVMRKKRVLYFIPGLEKSHGGVYQYSMGLLRAMRYSRHHFFVLCYHPEKELEELAMLLPNVTLIPYSRRKAKWLLFCYKLQGFINRSANIILRTRVVLGNNLLFSKIIRRYAIDIIHCPTQRLLRMSRCAAITTIHDVQQLHFPSFFSRTERVYRQVNYPAYIKKSDAVIASYRHIKDDLITFYRASAAKIFVCLLDMDNLWFRNKNVQAEKYPVPTILYPAATWPHKNHMNLICALKFLNEKGIRVNLVCTGNQTAYYREIKKEAERLGMSGQVTFEGIVSDETLFALYHRVSAVVVPTLYEAGSFPLMESILMRIPVVCARVTSLPETIGDDAFTFDPENVEDMAEKIYKIVFDADYRLSNNACLERQAVYLQHTGFVAKIEAVYEQISK